jgi:DNA polymerase-3 subunit gamma/tau
MTDSLFHVDEPHKPKSLQPATGAGGGSQSLYRKYRPSSFAPDELFGQDHVVNTLRNAIRLDRIAHAYLFCGPRGTGKTTTARILAKAVNCLDPDPANGPCNACDACRAINANATTDVIEIDAASNRGIDDIRDLRERVKYAPTSLQTKFYIIDEAHQITGAAANAFLKTLEEPPAHTRFVLATTDPEELLQTIVSRCQRFDFRRINLDAMTACLSMVAKAETIEIEPDAVTTIARHATGSLRDALGILDQVSVYRNEDDAESNTVTLDLVRTVLGVSRNDRVEGLVRAIADHSPGDGLTIINDAMEAGEDVRQLGRQLVGYVRMLLLERASGSPDADQVARELASRFELSQLADVARRFAEIDYRSRHAAIAQLPLELALIQACLSLQNDVTTESRPATSARSSAQGDVTEDAAPDTDRRQTRQGPSLKDRVRGASMGTQAKAAAPIENTAPQTSDIPPTADTVQSAASEGDQAPQKTAAQQEPKAQPTPTPVPAVEPMSTGGDIDRIVERWNDIRMDVKAMNRRTEALLQQADPVKVDGSQLILVAAYPFHQKRLNDDDTRKVIESVIERHLGKPLTVTCVSREDAARIRPAATTSDAMPSAEHGAPAQSARNRDDDQPATTTDSGATTPGAPSRDASEPQSMQRTSDLSTIATTPSSVSSPELDEERIKAAMNIFDAVIVDSER